MGPHNERAPSRLDDAASSHVESELPDADLDALRTSLDLIRLTTRWIHHLERGIHRPAGWSFAGFRIMFCVWVADSLEPRDIAHLSGLSRAAVSSALNTLERDGLVTRSRDHADGRLVTVRLTDGGRSRLAEAYQRQNDAERDFFAGLGDDAAAFRRSLQVLLASELPSTGS